jgi:hypothetical protein
LPADLSRARYLNLFARMSMKSPLILALVIPLLAMASAPTPKLREQKIALTDTREVIIASPDGFSLVTGQDPSGFVVVKLSDEKESVTIDLQFLPDPESKYATPRARMELMHEMFVEFVEDSTEQAMQFNELEPRFGAGTYCVFTDKKLLGKTDLPRGEYIHLTTGIKAWPGVIAVFRCFSNDTNSPAYKAVMEMLRESVHEKPSPLK